MRFSTVLPLFAAAAFAQNSSSLGPDKDGKYKPGKNTTQDTITFKYSDTYVKDETNPVKGVQEFAAEVSLSPKILSLHFP